MAHQAPGGTAILLRAAFAAALFAAHPAQADGVPHLQPGQAPAVGVQSMPRVVDGVPAAVRGRVNAALAAADRRVAAARADCLSPGNPAALPARTWSRTVKVTQAGPRWLSLLVGDDHDCGGPYPSAGTFPLVFDLRTGRPPDWTRLLPPSLAAEDVLDTAADGTRVGLVRSAALLRRAKAQAEPECQDVLDSDSGRFAVWPEDGGLTAVAFGLAHAVAACASPVHLTAAQLRALGGAELAASIAPGHAPP